MSLTVTVQKGHDFSKMHIKAIIVDGRHLYMGSANFSKSAMGVNAECGFFFDSKDLVKQFLKHKINTSSLDSALGMRLGFWCLSPRCAGGDDQCHENEMKSTHDIPSFGM